jgi:hypothetical protein
MLAILARAAVAPVSVLTVKATRPSERLSQLGCDTPWTKA